MYQKLYYKFGKEDSALHIFKLSICQTLATRHLVLLQEKTAQKGLLLFKFYYPFAL